METNIISELTTFIEHAPTAFHAVAELKEILKQEGFDETLVKRWFKQITVLEDHFTVELKSGLKIDIEG